MKALILTKFEYLDWMSTITHGHDVHFVTTPNYLASSDVFKNPYDVGISFMWTSKVPVEEVNSHTWFNFHPAPLPEYKGRNLCYHAIMNGAKEFGATLHYMDENFDTGDIIEVTNFGIPEYFTSESLSLVALEHSKDLFKKYLPRILAGEEFKRKPNVGGTYYKKDEIMDEAVLYPDEPFAQYVRAVTYKEFYPKINIGGVKYKIVRDE